MNHVDLQIARNHRADVRSLLRTAEEGEFGRIDRIDMTRHPGDTRLIFVNDADEMPVRIFIEMPPMDYGNYFAFFENHNFPSIIVPLHGRRRLCSTARSILRQNPDGQAN